MRHWTCAVGWHRHWTAWGPTGVHWRLIKRRCGRCNIEQTRTIR